MKKNVKHGLRIPLCPYANKIYFELLHHLMLCLQMRERIACKSLMMSRTVVAGILITFLQSFSANAQSLPSASSVHALTVGEKVPDLTISYSTPYSSGISRQKKISDYRGKLLIIDFWATWCSPCITLLPKTDSLSKLFSGQVEFLAVTYQEDAVVRKFLSRSPRLSALQLPIVTADLELHSIFPHRELPHYVWIDAKGVVAAITGHEEVSAAVIRKMLSGKPVVTAPKSETNLNFDRKSISLLQAHPAVVTGKLAFASVVSTYIDGLSSRYDIIRDPSGEIMRITATNAPLTMLFALAWSNGKTHFTTNRILIDVEDSTRFSSSAQGRESVIKWFSQNSFCYELTLPQHLRKQAFTIMQEDLRRNFPRYSVSVDTLARQCLVLVRTGQGDHFASRGGTPKVNSDAFSLSMTSGTTGLLCARLATPYLQHLPTPLVDGTGYTGKIDISLQANLSNVDALRKALRPYDLDLEVRRFPISVLVIRDTQ